jgi:hypothetical protein
VRCCVVSSKSRFRVFFLAPPHMYWIMPTSNVISIDRKEGIVAVLIATFLERH